MTKTPDEIKKGLECCIKFLACVPAMDCCEYCPYIGSCCELEKDSLAYIQQLQAKVPKWISVEERLPSITGKYIVCTAKGSVYCTKFSVHKVGGDFHTPDSYTRITHWMPLPSTEGLNDN